MQLPVIYVRFMDYAKLANGRMNAVSGTGCGFCCFLIRLAYLKGFLAVSEFEICNFFVHIPFLFFFLFFFHKSYQDVNVRETGV